VIPSSLFKRRRMSVCQCRMKRDVPHFRIGLLLTEAGIIAPEQLDDAISKSEKEGQPFLRVLVGSGELKHHELQAVIRAQSLIWSGWLDVEKAIKALSMVHQDDVSIDEGLSSVGWIRPAGTNSDTIASSVQEAVRPLSKPSSEARTLSGPCQYCGTPLEFGATLCPFCTGENQRSNSTRITIEPAWQRQSVPMDGSVLIASIPARDPLLMAFLSGCCLAGLGQILIGQSAKGAVVVFLAILLAFMTTGLSTLVVFPLAALDAYLLAAKLRKGKTVGLWEFF